MEGYNNETKTYHSFAMQFGWGMSCINYKQKKRYTYIDKRTKKYGAQRTELLKNK